MPSSLPERANRLAVISDTHANILALRAVLGDIKKAGVDGIVHLGDAIGFGPRPAECLDLLITTPGIIHLMGNHDSWCLKADAGPGKPAGILSHLEWTWAQVNPAHRAAMEGWPFLIEQDFGGAKIVFQHYALDPSGTDFQEIERPPASGTYDRKFALPGIHAIFFGHDHSASETSGRCRYLDPGSLGAVPDPVARWILASFNGGKMHVEKRAIAYDRGPLWSDFDELKVPARTEIIDRFYRSAER